MRIYVTGTTGFIGSNLVNKLSRNHEVTCYIRPISKLDKLKGIKFIKSSTLKDIAKSDIVFHIAGILGGHKLPESEYFKVNAGFTDEVVRNMHEGQKLVYLSTGQALETESVYARSKLAAEYSVTEGKADYCIIRPGFVYGPGDLHHLPLFKIINTFNILTPIIGNGKNRQSPIYIDDMVNLLIKGIDSKGILYGCSQVVTTDDFFNAIAKALKVGGLKIHATKLPKAIRNLARWDFFTKDRPNEPLLNSVDLSFGLARTVNWYHRFGYL